VRARVPLNAQIPALTQSWLVFGVERRTTADDLQNSAQACIVGNQQGAGGRTHEHLDAGAARQPLQLREMPSVVGGRTHKKREVAMHAVMATPDLIRQGFRVHGQRIGVGHLEYGGDPAHHCRKRAALQVFLVGKPGLAKMDLGVDHPGQQVQPAAINHLAGGSLRQIADGGETAGTHAEVTQAFAVMVDDRAAFEDQVVAIGHAGMCLNGLEPCLTALTFRREFWQETIKRHTRKSHAGSSSPGSRRGQGCR